MTKKRTKISKEPTTFGRISDAANRIFGEPEPSVMDGLIERMNGGEVEEVDTQDTQEEGEGDEAE